MSEKQQKLVLAIIDFLNQSIGDGTVKEDDREGLEVAVQCIGEAFGVNPSDDEQKKRLSIPASLPAIFDVFLKTQLKAGAQAAAPAPPSGAAGGAPSPDVKLAPTDADKAQAEKFKATGNTLMSSKLYDQAIEAYTKAIALDGTNPVYYSNRAAAHSSKGDHDHAIIDAEKAVDIDASFTKAYHRLGHAQYSLGDYSAAADAFQRGLDVDPSNANLKAGLDNAKSRITPAASSTVDPAAVGAAGAGGLGGMGGMADLLRGMGGGGAGGMPDMASFMNNPMMMQMAQQMMANGGMERLMQNPTVANMMNRAQSGGGMPSMDELMGDPTLRDLAGQFMGGAGRGRGGE